MYRPFSIVASVVGIIVLLGLGVQAGLPSEAPVEEEGLSVEDFKFDGPLGSAGAEIEKLGKNHFKVTLGHAPEHSDWPNKLNFQITDNARGNDLLLEVAFNGGDAYTFNEYFQSWSYDGKHWQPIQWERGYEQTPQRDVLDFPTFTEDQVYVGTQVPFSYKDLERFISTWRESPYVQVTSVGTSARGRKLYRIEITASDSPHPRSERWVHYLANQHPGEHNSQWRMIGMIEQLLSEEAADLRKRSIFHFVLMMSPDAPSQGWYRVNQAGVDMNRSYRPEGADKEEQTREPYLWQKDLEALMASEAPPTTVWAMHTWQGRVEPLLRVGPEMGAELAPWEQFKSTMKVHDEQNLIEPLDRRTGAPSYGSISWAAGPHAQFGVSAVLCEGGGNLYTKQENKDTGVALLESIAAFYKGTK